MMMRPRPLSWRWAGLVFAPALNHPSSLSSREALLDAAKPKGKIGEALVHFAHRLAHVDAAYEMTTGTMELEFDDGQDYFMVDPRSPSLRQLIREHGAEGAGDALADAFERMNKRRGLVLNAIFGCLAENGFAQDSQELEYVGRNYREFALVLDRPLTEALESEGDERAVAVALADGPNFIPQAQEKLRCSPTTCRLPQRPLPAAVPPPVALPAVTGETAARIDARADEITARTHEPR